MKLPQITCIGRLQGDCARHCQHVLRVISKFFSAEPVLSSVRHQPFGQRSSDSGQHHSYGCSQLLHSHFSFLLLWVRTHRVPVLCNFWILSVLGKRAVAQRNHSGTYISIEIVESLHMVGTVRLSVDASSQGELDSQGVSRL